MRDGWEIVETRRRKKSAPRRVYLSLNKRGEIVMNVAAWERIRKPANVTLLYDRTRGSIGVKFPVGEDRNFFPVRRYGRGGRTRIVRAGRLLKQFGIEVGATLIFRDVQTELYRKEPMLVLNLVKEDR